MPYYTDPEARLLALLDTQERRIAQAFRAAVREVKGEIDLDELADLIEQGRLEEALDKVKGAGDRTANATSTAFIQSGQSTAEFLEGLGVGRVQFNVVNHLAVAAMQANRLRMITEFTNEQRRAVSAALIAGVEGGVNPRDQARNFRDAVGLTEKQWRAVARYRSALENVGRGGSASEALSRALRDRRSDSAVLNAARNSRPLGAERIDSMVRRYADRYVKYRAQVIARTEALGAVHAGNEEAYRQAIADGVLQERQIERTWSTRLDGRERETHQALNGEARGWGEVWLTPHGTLRYPGDPEAPASEIIQCRCALMTRILVL